MPAKTAWHLYDLDFKIYRCLSFVFLPPICGRSEPNHKPAHIRAELCPFTMSTQSPTSVERIHNDSEEPVECNASWGSEKTEAAEDPEQLAQAQSKEVDQPPDGGYGWCCVACVFLINAHTWGVNSVCFSHKFD